MKMHQRIEQLKKRFFYLTEQGGHRVYWDSVSGTKKRAMHLIEALIGMDRRSGGDGNEIGANFKDYLVAISNSYFRAIDLTPVYRPEQPEVVSVADNWYPNLWRSPSVKPKKGATSKFEKHLKMMLGSQDKAGYLLDLLAYRYQNPDHIANPKPHIACYFYGEPGMGKGTFLKVIQNVFGGTALKVAPDQAELKGGSSVDLWGRTWLFVEEVDVKKGSTYYNKIKTIVGGDFHDGDRKYEHVRRHETPAQLIMFSNSAPTFIEPNDRRFFISKWEHEFSTPQDKTRYFQEYYEWLDREGTYPAIAYLLKHRDISHLQIAAPAMMTEEKEQVISLVRDDVVEDIRAEVADSMGVVFTSDSFSEIWLDRGVKPNERKHKLSEAGLSRSDKKRYREGKSSKTFELWTAPNWKLNAKAGVQPMLVSQEDSKPLKEDTGYRSLW